MKIKVYKLCITVVVLITAFLLSPFLIQEFENHKIFTVEEVPNQDIAIVFGAGIKENGEPSDALNDRLIVASELYKNQKVKTILVSGDNSFEDYDEPTAMAETLIKDFSIPKETIILDFAGRRTYDTCIRAKTLWKIDSAILVSQDFHLARALYTCESLGIESIGVSASLQPYIFEKYYKSREYLATLKMLIDLYIWAPNYIH